MEIKYTLVLFFIEYGAVAKKTPENKCLTKSIYMSCDDVAASPLVNR